MLNLNDAIRDYLASCAASGCAETTLANYRRALESYAQWLGEPSGDVTPATVAAYKASLSQRGLRQSTIRAYLVSLRLFYAWCVELGLASASPCTSAVTKTKLPPRHSYEHLLTAQEMAALLSPVRPSGATRATWPRTYAMTVLYLTSALRNTELRELTLSDLDYAGGTIHVRSGKGGKERLAPFTRSAQAAVSAYAATRPADLPPDAPLFGKGSSAADWHSFGRTEVSGIVERYVRLVTGRSGVRTHALRHSSASLLFDSGLPLEDIADLLGHASPDVTRRVYVDRLSPDRPIHRAQSAFDGISAAT